jgi:cytoskeletal protein RodZ
VLQELYHLKRKHIVNTLLNRTAGQKQRSGWWPVIIASLLIALVVESQTEAVFSFFQSPPQSPVLATNTPLPPPTNTPPPAPTNTPQPQATNTPQPAPTDASAVEPTNTAPPVPTDTPMPPQPEATPTPTATAQPTVDSAAVEVAPTITLPPPVAPPVAGAEEQGASSGVVVNEVELIDTVVEWFAYLWLCVGVAIILVVPFLFLFLQVRGKHLNR